MFSHQNVHELIKWRSLKGLRLTLTGSQWCYVLKSILGKKKKSPKYMSPKSTNPKWLCETVSPSRRSWLPVSCSDRIFPHVRTTLRSPLPAGSGGGSWWRGCSSTGAPALREPPQLCCWGQCWLTAHVIFFWSSFSQYINKFVFV